MGSLVSIVQDALASVSSALPDAVRTLRHGTETGDAIKSSSVEMSGEAASESGAVEKLRVIVKAADFPTLAADALVALADELRVVTTLRSDPIGATLTVGLSDALAKCAATVVGTRGARPIRLPVGLLAVCNGLATDYDGYAPTTVQAWTLCISVEDWPEASAPQIGDEVRFLRGVEDVRVKVARCNRRDGFFILTARSR